ncbi:MAG: ribose 5-phosphate isomerase B [Candidatus Omnitrophota bacterium]|nr:MAG: ribose 5-phosphate isomerase B [Candidatus Omnitrophota bacterium]
MRIAIGSDHRGYLLKKYLKQRLREEGYVVYDFGTNSQDPCDYPQIAFPLSLAVRKGDFERGILICATGIGMSIAANKVKGIRAALCLSPETARLSREHNDANILILGGMLLKKENAEHICKVWLDSDFLNERHSRRLRQIEEFEERCQSG